MLIAHTVKRFTLYSKSEKSRPPLPPLNPGGAPLGGPKDPLLAGRPLPPRGPMKPLPRKPPLPRLYLRGMPNVSAFIRLSSAQVGLLSLTNKDWSAFISLGKRKAPKMTLKARCHWMKWLNLHNLQQFISGLKIQNKKQKQPEISNLHKQKTNKSIYV